MKFTGNTKEHLQLKIIDNDSSQLLQDISEGSLTILWFLSGINEFTIDGQRHTFSADEIVFLTEFHRVEIERIGEIRFLRFNRPFYCVLDHDAEVGCKGVLFFGASQLPIINIPDSEKEKLEVLWKMFTIEMQSNDNLKIDMLQMMLKRYLILCTRLYKLQTDHPKDKVRSDIVREFNFLVEQNFRVMHNVADYAKLLNKSPKTISNIFSKKGVKSPLQLIQDRVILEARRLLRYTDMQVQEVAYEVGYSEVQAFSRFFKKREGMSPSEYKAN